MPCPPSACLAHAPAVFRAHTSNADACSVSTKTPSSFSRSHHTVNLLELANVFFHDLIDKDFIIILPSIYSYSDRAPCILPMTPSGLLSLGAKPPLVLHTACGAKSFACPSSLYGPSYPNRSSLFTTCHRPHVSSCNCTSKRYITVWSIVPKLELALHYLLSTACCVLQLHIEEIHQIHATLSITQHPKR